MSNNFSNLQKWFKRSELGWWEVSILMAFFIVFPLGQFERIGLTPSRSFYIHDLLCIFWLIAQRKEVLARIAAIRHLQIWNKRSLEIILLGWVLLGMIFAFITTWSVTPFLYLSRLVVYIIFAWSIGKKLQIIPNTLGIILCIVGGLYWWLALLQYIFLPDTRFLWLYGWDEHYYRMIGTLFDPGFTGMLFILATIVVWSIRKSLPLWVFIVANIAFISGVVFTFSRASYLAFAISIVFFACLSIKKIQKKKNSAVISILAVIIFGGAYLLAPKPGGDGVQLLRTTSAQARVISISQSLSGLTRQQWILGSGLFTSNNKNSVVGIRSQAQMPDNIFITLLTQTGVIGLVLGLVLGIKLLLSLSQKNLLFFIAIIAVIIHSQFNNTLLQPFIFLYLMLFLAT